METGGRLDRLAPPFLRNEDVRVKSGGLLAAFWEGRTGFVAIVMLDPFEERLAGGGRYRGGHGYPLVPTARRYSVT